MPRLSAASWLSSTTRIRCGRRSIVAEALGSATAGCTGISGSRTVKLAALAHALAGAATWPPCASTSERTRARPMPRPVWIWPSAAAVALREHVEDVGQHLRRDADAGVLHRDDAWAALARGGDRDPPRPRACTWRRCSAGSANTWARRTGSAYIVSGSDVTSTVSVCLPAADDRRAGFDRRAQDRRQIRRLAPQFDLAERDPRHLEQILDQPHHLRDLPFDDLAGRGRLGRRRIPSGEASPVPWRSAPADCAVRGRAWPGTDSCGGRPLAVPPRPHGGR